MDEQKKETKVAEVKKETKKEETKPKFEKASKKEADKANKEAKKDKKTKKVKTDKKEKGSKTWVPTLIVAIVVIAVIAILTVMIVASTSPKKSIDGLFTNLKAGNFEKAQEYLSGDETSLTDESLDEDTQKLLFEKLSWSIKKVTSQDDEKATVEVEIRNKDFQTVVNNYAKKALSAAKEALSSGSSDSISEESFQNYFVEELKNEEIEVTSSTKTLNLVKEDGKWKVVLDNELGGGLLPGLEETIENLT